MQNSESQEAHEEDEDAVRILDMIAARYDLQIQQHTEELRQLRQKHLDEQRAASAFSAPDFVIRPRRAA